MYKFFKFLGLLFIVLISFTYTESLTKVVKEYDKLMLEIKDKESLYKRELKEAEISNNTIIPGISKRTVDLDKSYSNMRMYNKFNEELLVYKYENPKALLKDNLDKYIINTQKEEVSIIVKTNNFDADMYNNNLSFYMDNSFIKNNTRLIIDLVNKNHTILSNNSSYLKNVIGQKECFCMTLKENKELLDKCVSNKCFTIIPNIVESNYYKLNSILKGGSIILADNTNYKDIIKMVNKRGLKIVSIADLLRE